MAFTLPSVEDIRAIKSGEIEKINVFFLQSVDFIRLCACGFYTRFWKKAFFTESDIDELVNEAYLHLQELDYDSVGHFVISLRDVFQYFQYGGKILYYRYYAAGKQLCESLDAPVKIGERTGDYEEGESRVDLLKARKQISCTKTEKRYAILLKVVCGFLTDKEYEVFRYRLLTGYSAEEIAEELGKTKGAVLSQMCTMKKALIMHYDEILDLLSANGVKIAKYYVSNGIIPPDYEKVKAFYEKRRTRCRERARRLVTETDGRERKNEYMRAYRARKKQEKQARQAEKTANSAKEI